MHSIFILVSGFTMHRNRGLFIWSFLFIKNKISKVLKWGLFLFTFLIIQHWLKPINFLMQRRGDAEFLKFFKKKFSAPLRLCVEK